MSIRLVRGACAALAGSALAVSAATAVAAPKPVPESFKYKAGRTLLKDNSDKALGGPQGTIFVGPQNSLVLRAVNTRRGRNGLVVTKSLDLFAQDIPDPRTATLPISYTAASGLRGSFLTLTQTNENPMGSTLTWNVDASGAAPFVLKVLKYDGTTHRMSGTFSGTLRAGAEGQKDLKVTAGKFALDMTIQDISPPPPGKR